MHRHSHSYTCASTLTRFDLAAIPDASIRKTFTYVLQYSNNYHYKSWRNVRSRTHSGTRVRVFSTRFDFTDNRYQVPATGTRVLYSQDVYVYEYVPEVYV